MGTGVAGPQAGGGPPAGGGKSPVTTRAALEKWEAWSARPRANPGPQSPWKAHRVTESVHSKTAHAPPGPCPLSASSGSGSDRPFLGNSTHNPRHTNRFYPGAASRPLSPNMPLMQSPPPTSTPRRGPRLLGRWALGPQHRPASPRSRQSLRGLPESGVPERRPPTHDAQKGFQMPPGSPLPRPGPHTPPSDAQN